jgi:hypothetical protein
MTALWQRLDTLRLPLCALLALADRSGVDAHRGAVMTVVAVHSDGVGTGAGLAHAVLDVGERSHGELQAAG